MPREVCSVSSACPVLLELEGITIQYGAITRSALCCKAACTRFWCNQVQCVITVRKLDIVALRKGKPGIPRAGNTLVLLIHHHDAGVLGPELLTDGKAVIRRAIIQHDDLQLLIGLTAKCFPDSGKAPSGRCTRAQ